MRYILFSLFVSALLLTPAPGQGTAAKSNDIAGAWILNEQFPDETHAHRLTLEVSSDKITGHSGQSKIEGSIAGEVLTLKWLTPDGYSGPRNLDTESS